VEQKYLCSPLESRETERNDMPVKEMYQEQIANTIPEPSDSPFPSLHWRERSWARFRLWRQQRPFWGALLLILAGGLVLWAPVNLLSFLYCSESVISGGLLLGTLLILMGVLQLITPAHALITGSVGSLLALLSVPIAFGGMGIGVFLGLIGGALSVAWRMEGAVLTRGMTTVTTGSINRRVYWPMLGGSFLALMGMGAMITHGAMAVAVIATVPMHATAARIKITDLSVHTTTSDNTSAVVVRKNLEVNDLDTSISLSLPQFGHISVHMKSNKAMVNGLTAKLTPDKGTLADLDAAFMMAESASFEGVSVAITQDNA
jgi:hypothetical protein